MLELLDEDQPIEIIYALHQGNGERLMKTIQTVAEKAGDWDELLAETAEKLHQIALMQLLAKSVTDENDHLGFLAKHISPEDVQFFYQVIVSGRKELASAPNRRIGAEMTLLRALAFHPKSSLRQHKRLNKAGYPLNKIHRKVRLKSQPVSGYVGYAGAVAKHQSKLFCTSAKADGSISSCAFFTFSTGFHANHIFIEFS